MRQTKTEDNVTQTCIKVSKERDNNRSMAFGKKRSLISRLKKSWTAKILGGAILLNLVTMSACPSYANSLRYGVTKATDSVKNGLTKRQEYVVQPGDTLWDLAGGEIEGEDYHLYHQRNLEKHLYRTNMAMPGMNIDGTLISDEVIFMKDVNGNDELGF